MPNVSTSARENARSYILEDIRQLVHEAELWGLVVTVEQLPLSPLAMGNHETCVSIRDAREMAEVVNDPR